MKSLSLKELAWSGVIAAIYAILTLAFAQISFAVYQVRIAEALTVLPFVSRAGIPGLFIGCLIANSYGMGWQDIVFGSLITLLAAVATRQIAHIPDRFVTPVIALVPGILLWGGAGAILGQQGLTLLTLAALIVSMLLVLWIGLRRAKIKSDLIGPVGLVFSGLALIVGLVLAPPPEELKAQVIAYLAFAAAWLIGLYALRQSHLPGGAKQALAPLPPVLFNAFGVSLYLAPILEVDYWFAVQMVGIGQLIACYLIGLPLLRIVIARRLLT